MYVFCGQNNSVMNQLIKGKNLMQVVNSGPENQSLNPGYYYFQIPSKIRCPSLPVGVTAGIKHSPFLGNLSHKCWHNLIGRTQL